MFQTVKKSVCDAGEPSLIPGSERFPWQREWLTAAVLLPGEFHGQEEPGGLQSMGLQRVGRGQLAHLRVRLTLHV